MLQYLVFLGAAVNLFGSFSYIKGTLAGVTKPNRVTWLLWSIAPMIAAAAALSSGLTWVVLPVFMSGFVPFLVFLSSFVNKNSYWQISRFDYFCGALSILALVLWGITKQPNIAIIFAILSDALAALPTLIKAWKHPETENRTVYATGFLNALTGFAAIHIWMFAEFAFPIYLVFINSSLLIAASNKINDPD